MGLIGTIIIVIAYMLTMCYLGISNKPLATRIVRCVYWFVIGFWDIVSVVYFDAGNTKAYVLLGIAFCTMGIIYFIIDMVKNYYDKTGQK